MGFIPLRSQQFHSDCIFYSLKTKKTPDTILFIPWKLGLILHLNKCLLNKFSPTIVYVITAVNPRSLIQTLLCWRTFQSTETGGSFYNKKKQQPLITLQSQHGRIDEANAMIIFKHSKFSEVVQCSNITLVLKLLALPTIDILWMINLGPLIHAQYCNLFLFFNRRVRRSVKNDFCVDLHFYLGSLSWLDLTFWKMQLHF